jgi:hypothetical protein
LPRHDTNFGIGALNVRHLDVVVMFVCLWLLASMVLDAVTPDEFSIYMIGAAIAPAMSIAGALYWFRVPAIDFAVIFAVLWMTSEMALEMITPRQLSPVMALIAVAPMVIVGMVLNVQRLRRMKFGPLATPRATPDWTAPDAPGDGITLKRDGPASS